MGNGPLVIIGLVILAIIGFVILGPFLPNSSIGSDGVIQLGSRVQVLSTCQIDPAFHGSTGTVTQIFDPDPLIPTSKAVIAQLDQPVILSDGRTFNEIVSVLTLQNTDQVGCLLEVSNS